jgi:alpha-tubulin suppressor-like RCC1 family protein
MTIGAAACSRDVPSAAPSALSQLETDDARVLASLASVSQVEVGPGHTCALDGFQTAWCWGMNWAGEIGNGTVSWSVPTPAVVYKKPKYLRLTLGMNFTCGLDAAHKTWCWGTNGAQQLADGTTSGRTVPGPASTPLFNEIDAGHNHACGVDLSNQVWCWGENVNGELGAAFTSPASDPVLVSGAAMKGVTAGVSFSCAIEDVTQLARCWGLNDEGQLGDGSTTSSSVPVAVAYDIRFLQLSAGRQFACGVTVESKVMCWGSNELNRLGTGSTVAFETHPVNVSLPEDIAYVSAGYHHACALGVSGAVYCWGGNYWGQVGDGTTIDRPTPVPVAGGFTFSSLRAAGSGGFNCGVVGTRARCWGSNNFSQLGDGTVIGALSP